MNTWPPKKLDNFTTHALCMASGTILDSSASTALLNERIVEMTITGQPVSLKNSRRLLKNRRSGKFFSAKSTDAERYVSDFCNQVPAEYRNLKLGALDRPLRVIISAFYESRLSDLDMAIVFDALQLSEVIANDRYIQEQHVYGGVDKKNPRVEIIVEEI